MMSGNLRWISRTVFTVAALVGLSGFRASTEEVNRIRNDGFEETSLSSWIPQGPVKIITGQEGREVYRGKQCLLIHTAEKAITVYQEKTGVPGMGYGYRFAVRGSGRFFVRLYENNAQGNCGAPLVVENNAGPEWKEYTGELQTKNPAASDFSLVIGAEAGSDVYFDEIAVWEKTYVGGNSRFDYGMGDQSYDRLAAEPLVSRHVPWANPLAGGKLKTLVICPNSMMRGVIELAQRLEMDYTIIPTGRSDTFYGPGSFADIQPVPGYSLIVDKLARERLAPERYYDLIIVAAFSWQALPDFVRENILQRVMNGAGLLYREYSQNKIQGKAENQPKGKNFILDVLQRSTDQSSTVDRLWRQFPMNMLPLIPATDEADAMRKCIENGGTEETDGGWRGGSWWKTKGLMPLNVKCGVMGKGRVTFLDYYQGWNYLSYGRGAESWLTPHNLVTNPIYYEYYYSWLVKLCLWTAAHEGRDSDVLEVKVPEILNRETMAGTEILLPLQTAVPEAIRCEYVIRDSQGDVVHCASPEIQGVTRQITVTMPVLPWGNYTLDIWLLTSEKAKVTFVSTQFAVTDPGGIEKLTTGRDRYNDGDIITGMFSLRAPLRPGERLEASLRDSWNRILANTALTDIDGINGTFSLPLRLPLSYSIQVKVELIDSHGTVDRKSVLVGIPITENCDFYLITSGLGYAKEPGDRFVAEQVIPRFPAFNAARPWGGLLSTAQQYAQWNMPSFVYVNSQGWSGGHNAWKEGLKDGPHGPEFKTCLTAVADGLERLCQSIGSANAPFAVVGHEINCEDMLIPEFCFCERCLPRFRSWLKTIYNDDIAALNREWSSDYTDFSQVMPARLDELQECEAKGGAARWLDSRYFMYDQVWTQLYRNEALLLKSHYDRVNTQVNNAWFVQVENFTPFIWENLFKDVKGYGCEFRDYGPADSLMYEMAADFGQDRYYSGPWLDPCWSYNTGHHKMRVAPWWLLFHGARGIVMWGLGPNPDVAGGIRPLTADLSYALDYFKILHEQAAEAQEGIATLLTSSRKVRSPIAMVISSRNSFAARLAPQSDCSFRDAFESHFIALQTMGLQPQFVGQDDLTPELIREKGWKVLVLPYNRAMSIAVAQVLLDFVKSGGLLLADNQPGIFTEHGRKLETGSLAALYPSFAPELYRTQYGKGEAVYLGGQLNGAQRMILAGNFSRLYPALELFRTRSIEPPVRITDASGVDRFEVFRALFKYGTAQYLGVLQDPAIRGASTGETSFITFGAKRHVYDMRRKEYLGFTDRIETAIKPEEARVFALLPARMQAFSILPARENVKRGDTLPVTFKMEYTDGDGREIGNCVVVQVTREDGMPVRYYNRKVTGHGSYMHWDIPISLNESAGIYTISAMHVATGMKAVAEFTVGE